jgi:hypothetical protein
MQRDKLQRLAAVVRQFSVTDIIAVRKIMLAARAEIRQGELKIRRNVPKSFRRTSSKLPRLKKRNI